MSTQPPDPTPTGAYQPQAAAQYQTAPATQAVPVSGAAQQYQAVPATAAAPPDAKKARGLLEPYRELAAFGLLGAVALILLAGLVRVLTGLFNSFLATATASFSNVIGFEVILLPIVAVALVLLIDPVTPRAKAVVIGALVEYAIAAVLGLVLLLAGLIGDFQDESPIGWALGAFLEHLAGLGLIGLGLFLTARIFLGAYSAPKPVGAPYQGGYQQYPQGYGYPQQQYTQQQQYAQQTGYVTGSQPAAQPQQAAAYAQQQQPATQGWQQQQQPATGSTPAVAAQPQQAYPGYATPATGTPAAAPTSGGYTAPTGYATPSAAATPLASAPPVTSAPPASAPPAVEAQPSSAPPALSSPFASYTAPAPTPVADEPVSASPAEAQASTPPGGFAAAGWPGGHSTHPSPSEEGTAGLAPASEEGTAAITPARSEEEGTAVITPAHQEEARQDEGTAGITPARHDEEGTAGLSPARSEEEGTAVLSPVDPDATQQAPIVRPVDPAADPDRTTVLQPGTRKDDGEETQRTQAIPPSN